MKRRGSGKRLSKRYVDLKRPKLNVFIREKMSFVGVAHLMRGGRSFSWALYRYKPRLVVRNNHDVGFFLLKQENKNKMNRRTQ